MNQRRKLVVALGAGALVAPFGLCAQPQGKVWRLGFLGTASASGYVKEVDAIRAGLRDLGYVENKNIAIEFRWAENDSARLKEMAAELVTLKVDVIITHSTVGARAAGQATKTIPVVMADGGDPVAAALVASLARPGGNITGSTSFQAEISAKRIELLIDAIPRIRRVAVLFNVTSNAVILREMATAAKQKAVELHEIGIRTPEEIPSAFSAMVKKRIEAVVILDNPLFISNAGALAALAITHRLPADRLHAFSGRGRPAGIRHKPSGCVWPCRQLRRQNTQGREARRPPGRARDPL